MSNMKKKKMKQPTRLRTLVASLMLIAPALHAANDTEFSPRPLVGVAASFAPHIALALSVEYPTAGAAYSESTLFSIQNAPNSSPATQKYLGYFDNDKCYKYNHALDASGNYVEEHDNGYFYPSSMAKSEGGLYGLCNSGSEKDEFSGNMLNYMTMTAIDIFRQAMTGGNRAKGVKRNDPKYTAGYEQGDTPTETFLRRASVQFGQNGQAPFLIADRRLDTFIDANAANRENTKATLRRLLPHFFIDVMSADSLRGQRTEHVSLNSTENAKIYGEPLRMGFYTVSYSPGAKLYAPELKQHFAKIDKNGKVVTDDKGHPVIERSETVAPAQTVTQGAWSKAGQYDKFADPYLHFFNDGFYLQIVRKITKGVRYDIPEDKRSLVNEYYSTQSTGQNGLMLINDKERNETYTPEYYAIIDPNDRNLSQHKAEARKWEKRLNVVIKVCDPKSGLELEENCKPYGQNYKPEGLLQEYTVNNKMRFATFGYLNIGDNSVDGGVLRSRMKWLINDTEESKGGDTFNATYGNEWSTTTGQFTINPDTEDARISDVARSGTINYLNQFGDTSGYKSFDPAAELYNTALTYLRGTHVGRAIYQQSSLTNAAKDGFPVIYDWDDPYKRGINPKAQHCHPNSIIFIGDTNTHSEAQVTTNNPEVVNYTTLVFNNEDDLKDNVGVNTNVGSGGEGVYSPAYMAGLAYWARTNNIRPDLTEGKEGARLINSSNFIIDVMEKNDAKASPMRNTYYLAAKYGGFTISKDVMQNNFMVDNKKVIPNRADWTSDAVGRTSISKFANGVPHNFAVANNPSSMKEALAKAMASGAALNNPSQAATGLSIGTGEILDLRGAGLNYLLQSTYNYAELTGDVVVYEPSWESKVDETTKVVTRNFKLNEKTRTGKKMKDSFHGTGYVNRKVFTFKNNRAYNFTENEANNIFQGINNMPSGVSAGQLVKYILGDNSLEASKLLRARDGGLQGTVINSTAMPILPAKSIQCTTDFNDTAKSRPVHYAAAANDGMLHIFNEEGDEKMAYMAGTALEKLPEFAKIGFQHQYLNDGTPVIKDMCLNNQATTVLVGTTGRGGTGVYALNVTDISNPSTNNVMWEFSSKDDAALGLTVSKPVITKSHDGTKQYAIVSSGYHTDGKAADDGYIFILDIGKAQGSSWALGTNYWKVKLGNAGVGAPFVFDGENDGIGDKIFVGDAEGQVWQLNRTDNAGSPFAVAYNNAPLFTPSNPKPITGAPFAEMVNGKLMVTVGTGRYFSEKDLSTTQTNYAYGLIADDQNPIQDNTANILEQQLTVEIANNLESTRVYRVTEEKMTDAHKGWRLTLKEGMGIAADALIRQRQVANFVFFRNTGDISAACVRGANAGVIEIDVRNGGRFPRPLVDTDGDGQFTDKDDSSAGAVEFEGISTSVGTNLFYNDPDTNKITPATYFNDGDKQRLHVLAPLSTEAGVRRISWREIF